MNSSCEAKSDASKMPDRAVTPARTLTSSATRRASSALRAARYRRAPSDAKRSASARAIGLVAPRIRTLVIVPDACAVLQAGYIASLRDRLDEKRLSGSATAFAACHLARFGYIARKVSGAMRASLARDTRP